MDSKTLTKLIGLALVLILASAGAYTIGRNSIEPIILTETIEVPIEVPIEVVREVPGPERIVEREVMVEKEVIVEREVIVEVPAEPLVVMSEELVVTTVHLGKRIFISLSIERPIYEREDLMNIRWRVVNNGVESITFEDSSRAQLAGLVVKNESGWTVWSDNNAITLQDQLPGDVGQHPPLPGAVVVLDPGESWLGDSIQWDMTEQRAVCERRSAANSCFAQDIGKVQAGRYQLMLQAPARNFSFELTSSTNIALTFDVIES